MKETLISFPGIVAMQGFFHVWGTLHLWPYFFRLILKMVKSFYLLSHHFIIRSWVFSYAWMSWKILNSWCFHTCDSARPFVTWVVQKWCGSWYRWILKLSESVTLSSSFYPPMFVLKVAISNFCLPVSNCYKTGLNAGASQWIIRDLIQY